METLELLDWKRRVGELYAQVRAQADPRAGWEQWCAVRSRLFREHPQSPVPTEQRPAYTGPHVHAYDPAWRLLAEIFPAEPQRFELPSSDGQTMTFTRFGVARVADRALELDLYWLEGYGGGLFVPFADTTSGSDTYGAGRYVLDTVKGADLGMEDERLVLDLNFAYQPSCSYDPGWTCPLAPPANRIPLAVEAGERLNTP